MPPLAPDPVPILLNPGGGRSELLGDLAAAVAVLETGNDAAGWERLVDVLGVSAADRAAAAGPGRVDGDLVDQAPVARRSLPAGWRRVWEQGLAAPLAVGRGWESRSQLLAGLAVVCAAHGWTRAEWAAACRDVRLAGGDRARRRHDPRCPHSRPAGGAAGGLVGPGAGRPADRHDGLDGHVYVPRSPTDTARVVGEAWDSALRLLARARPAGPGRAGRPPAAEVLARVDAIAGRLAAAGWEGVDGLHDRQLLTGLLELAVRAGTHTLGGSVRHLALQYGLTKSTVARSLRRLAAADWLALALPHTGTQAAVWELLPPAEAPASSNQNAGGAAVVVDADGVRPAQQGRGTLGPRPPGNRGRDLEQAVDHDALSFRAGVQLRAHPLFDRSALGPGVGLVLSCIPAAGSTLDQLAAATGLAPHAVGSYLATAALAGLVDQVQQHGPPRMSPALADPDSCRDQLGRGAPPAVSGRRWMRRPVDLDAIADRVGATEVRARRRRAYDADRLAWAWYVADYDRRRGWAVERAAHRGGHRGGRHATPPALLATAQTELGLPLETRSFPRTGPDARSRACWTQARAAAADYLSTHDDGPATATAA